MPNPATDWTIEQGATFRASLLYLQPSLTVKTVTGISQSIVPVIAATGHGIPADVAWPVWIRGVAGMTKINHSAEQVGDHADAYHATRIDANTLSVESADTTDYTAYSSGGQLAYQPPVDLTGCTARMEVRANLDDADAVLTLTTATAAPASRLSIANPTSGKIDIEISDEDTAAIVAWESAVWDLEITHADGSKTRLASGTFSVSREVTRGG